MESQSVELKKPKAIPVENLEQLKASILETVNDDRIFLLANSDLTDEEMKSGIPNVSLPTFRDISDGIVTSVGFGLQGYAEMVVFIGPMYGELPMSRSEMLQCIRDVHHLVGVIHRRELQPEMIPGRVVSAGRREYMIEAIEGPGPGRFKEFTATATAFYESLEYSVMALVPIFRDSEAEFKQGISTRRN